MRRATTPFGRKFTLPDTVGFVRLLPHQLVEEFRSTLEEVGGAGLPELLQVLEDEVPHPETLVRVVLPYASGALVSRIHSEGEVLSEEHLGEGTRLSARPGPQLAAELNAYLVA